MALVAHLSSPSLYRRQRRRHLHHQQPPFINKSITSQCLRSFLSQTSSFPLTNTSTKYQLPLLQEIASFFESKQNLSQALTFLQQQSSHHEALDSLQQKQAMGLLLQACGQHQDIETGRQVHQMVASSTLFCNDVVLNTRLITMYSMCGSPLASRLVFDGLENKNLFQWNAMVSGYSRNHLCEEALRTFIELVSETEFKPDNFTLPCVIKACGGILDVGLGQDVHGMAVKLGLVRDVFVCNALVAFYGKCGIVDEAVKMFDFMSEKNLVSWNSMICVFSENGFSQESFGLFRKMLEGEESLV